MSTNVRINDAMRAHPAFRNKQSLEEYQAINNISSETHPFRVVNKIIRPIIEKLISTQKMKNVED